MVCSPCSTAFSTIHFPIGDRKSREGVGRSGPQRLDGQSGDSLADKWARKPWPSGRLAAEIRRPIDHPAVVVTAAQLELFVGVADGRADRRGAW